MTHTTRRTILSGMAGVATITFAGCMSSVLDDGGPAYDEDDHDDLVLTIDAFDDEDSAWHRDDELTENFDACFFTEDETEVVLAEVQIEDDVEAAEELFNQAKSDAWNPSDYDIADEAFWYVDPYGIVTTTFRHSNAIANVGAVRKESTGPDADAELSQQYASVMFDSWQ